MAKTFSQLRDERVGEKKKRLKDMSQEERREYDRIRKQKQRNSAEFRANENNQKNERRKVARLSQTPEQLAIESQKRQEARYRQKARSMCSVLFKNSVNACKRKLKMKFDSCRKVQHDFNDMLVNIKDHKQDFFKHVKMYLNRIADRETRKALAIYIRHRRRNNKRLKIRDKVI